MLLAIILLSYKQLCYTIPSVAGTGKTYTMLGTDAEPGIMVLTLNDLFRRMEQDQHVMKYRATIAYLEVQ